MILELVPGITPKQAQDFVEEARSLGASTHTVTLGERVCVIANGANGATEALSKAKQVKRAVEPSVPFKLASREFQEENTTIPVGDTVFGNGELSVIAGPCSAENRKQLLTAARSVKEAGAHVLRASLFKPRTSPYSFQGLGRKGLKLLEDVGKEIGLPTETEVMDPRDVKATAKHVDVLRVGARNMQNFDLLRELGKQERPVVLKRGLSATIKEFLMAAEYILSEGNPNVILCERGIRTFETSTRFTLDVASVAVLKELTHLPVIVDPSHAAGRRALVSSLAAASVAAGADGLLIEVHHDPDTALSDAAQQLTPEQFQELMPRLHALHKAARGKAG